MESQSSVDRVEVSSFVQSCSEYGSENSIGRVGPISTFFSWLGYHISMIVHARAVSSAKKADQIFKQVQEENCSSATLIHMGAATAELVLKKLTPSEEDDESLPLSSSALQTVLANLQRAHCIAYTTAAQKQIETIGLRVLGIIPPSDDEPGSDDDTDLGSSDFTPSAVGGALDPEEDDTTPSGRPTTKAIQKLESQKNEIETQITEMLATIGEGQQNTLFVAVREAREALLEDGTKAERRERNRILENAKKELRAEDKSLYRAENKLQDLQERLRNTEDRLAKKAAASPGKVATLLSGTRGKLAGVLGRRGGGDGADEEAAAAPRPGSPVPTDASSSSSGFSFATDLTTPPAAVDAEEAVGTAAPLEAAAPPEGDGIPQEGNLLSID